MRKATLAIIAILVMTGCNTLKMATLKDLCGTYIRQGNSMKIELCSDGTFVLYNPSQSQFPYCGVIIEQSEIASKGKWKLKSSDVLELTSENYYLRQKGYEYELKKENKFSQDSLYIKIIFPDDYTPDANNYFLFVKHGSEKSIETDKNFLVIPKSEYLYSKKSHSISINRIYFSIKANTYGHKVYRSRLLFNIFEEDIDTDETNYLTITLPYFDISFFEFEPLKDLIYIKNENKLYWRGDVWKKES